eukprot:TRINITY_DN13991_c0_g1_i1.p3 TRINITY_DN13991_c0_g1~~TRINITY_DN13991_c0_g1_i1.p3  ORF type:complete len:127 (-),score=34.33 TRINITY_DN13991_c0_g1_i1:96-476(-)
MQIESMESIRDAVVLRAIALLLRTSGGPLLLKNLAERYKEVCDFFKRVFSMDEGSNKGLSINKVAEKSIWKKELFQMLISSGLLTQGLSKASASAMRLRHQETSVELEEEHVENQADEEEEKVEED